MGNLLSPEIVPLLQGLKPYLGSGGKSLADSILEIVTVVTNESFQNAVQTVSQAVPKIMRKPVGPQLNQDQEGNGAVSAEGTNLLQGFLGNNGAFVLFLILVLLFYGEGNW